MEQLVAPFVAILFLVAFGLAKSLSPLVVATQLWIPFTALFAWKMLGETMKPLASVNTLPASSTVTWVLPPLKAAQIGVPAESYFAVTVLRTLTFPTLGLGPPMPATYTAPAPSTVTQSGTSSKVWLPS